MKVYGFDEAHADLVASGRKRQTVRPPRAKGHAAPGEPLRLYAGLRTKRARLLAVATCTRVAAVRVVLDDPPTVEVDGAAVDPVAFALAGGFADADAMAGFYRRKHGGRVFDGILVEWELAG